MLRERGNGRKGSADHAGALVVEGPAGNQVLHGHGVIARAQTVLQVQGVGALQRANALYLEHGLGARNDAMAMQYLIPGWTFDNKRPCMVR